MIDEIALALVNFDAALMNVNALASLPKRRRILQQIIKRSRISEQEIELLDPGVREHLAFYYPCGLDRFTLGKVKSSDVRAAAKTALASLPQPRRGRPKGSGNDAALSLARELAAIYENHSDAKPTRSVVVSKSLDLNVPNSRESGKFLKFFEIVTGALPFVAREKLTRAGGRFPALIHTALETRYPA